MRICSGSIDDKADIFMFYESGPELDNSNTEFRTAKMHGLQCMLNILEFRHAMHTWQHSVFTQLHIHKEIYNKNTKYCYNNDSKSY